ncbi:MAG: DUF6644 family protein [Pseudomonadota bacterium]
MGLISRYLEIFQSTTLEQWLASTGPAQLTLLVVHCVALLLASYAVVLVDLRMLGIGLINRSVATVNRETRLWFWLGIGLAITTEVLLLGAEPLPVATGEAVNRRWLALLAFLVFAWLVRTPIIGGAIRVHRGPRLGVRIVGLVSLCLWCTYLIFGRLIFGHVVAPFI